MALEVEKMTGFELSSLRKKVVFLIVEDDQVDYMLTKKYLRGAGIENELIWLKDGQIALDYLAGEGHPTVSGNKYIMLLDVAMPKVDGVEVLKKLKSDEHFKDISVIMLTTSEDNQVAQECYGLGCDAHIIKPPGEVLLKAIDRVSRRI